MKTPQEVAADIYWTATFREQMRWVRDVERAAAP